MTRQEFLSKWQAKACELEGLHAQVDAALLCRSMLADFEEVADPQPEPLLTRKEAARWSGYSEDHLCRMVKRGWLVPLRPGSPRGRMYFRKEDLPRKARQAHTQDTGVHELASRLFGGKERRHG